MSGVSPEALMELVRNGKPPLLLDIRDEKAFAEGHIRGSASAKLDTMPQMQVVIRRTPRDSMVVLIDEDGSRSRQMAKTMSRFGFAASFLEGGIAGWVGETVRCGQVPTLSGADLWSAISSGEDLLLLDVREPHEFAEFRIPGAVNVPLSRLFALGHEQKIPDDKRVVTVCSHGNRSMVATFALAQAGIEASSLSGGMSAWSQVLNHTVVAREENLAIIQVEKVGKGCLSYIIGSGGEAAVIDPVHPASEYLDLAHAEGLQIAAVLDTHQHADHVSAAARLAAISGAKLHLSSGEDYRIDAEKVREGDEIRIGQKRIAVLHTPGHTAGSMTYLVDGRYALCGDVVFMEGVGRPDLRDRAAEFAGELHETLHSKILQFPEKTVVLPAHHGPGAKPADGVYRTTVGEVGKMSLMSLDREEFVKRVAEAAEPRPMNYSTIIKINQGTAPVAPEQIPDLEMGPNRCSVRVQ